MQLLKFFFIFVFLIFFQSAYAQQSDLEFDRLQELENFYKVHDTVQAYYADPARVDTRQLIQSALRGMVGGLDDHTQYFPPEEYARIKNEGRGELAGVGITLSRKSGSVRVVAVLPGSPAEKSSITEGSRLIRIDEQNVDALFISEIVEKLRGPEGTEVTLELMDEKNGDLKKIALKRALFRIPSITRSELLTGNEIIAMIKIAYFNDDAHREFSTILKRLLSQKPVGIILDLRGNPGGSVKSAVEIASYFLERGRTIARIQERQAANPKNIASESSQLTINLPLAVLVDRGTSSAAEMLAAALQEHRKGVIVGERTFGKGSIQSLFDLPDGSGLRLTTAYYLTPLGRRIEESGVIPDIEVNNTPFLEHALHSLRTCTVGSVDENPAVEDQQLQRAADALRAVVIYSRKAGAN